VLKSLQGRNHCRVGLLELCRIALRNVCLMDADDCLCGYKPKLHVNPSLKLDWSIPCSTSECDEQTGRAFLIDR
jgi:hypothetical protein